MLRLPDTERILWLLDWLLVVTAAFLIITPAKIFCFHLIFVFLTFGAFFWQLRPFIRRAIFWVTTTTLVSAGKTSPRTVVGSVDTSEFLVTASASLGFLIGLGTAGINFAFVGALLVGGLLAAPLAAWLVSRLPATILGVAVGGLVIVTSLRTLTKSVEVVAANAGTLRTVALVAWAAAVVWAVIRHRRDRRAATTTLNARRVDGIPTTVPDAVGAGER